jgi:tetratricopeptide (TPR) repeat protein
VAALALLVAVIYWPTFANGFISDDMYYVNDTEKLASLEGLGDIWFKIGATPQYYPLVHTALWGEYHLFELEPRGYHVVSMLLHLGVALLLWRLLVRLAVPCAWLAAAIFAVHPVQVETVAWVSEQKNLLSAAFALSSILAYLRFGPLTAEEPAERNWPSYFVAIACFVAALLCKTVTITTPAVILVIYWWKRGSVSWRDVTPLVPFFAIGIALSFVTVWMERTVVGASGVEWDHSLMDRILIAGRAAWFYVGKLVWPYPLTFVYPRWRIDSAAWWQYLFPLAAIVLLVALWRLRTTIGRGPLAAALIFGGVLTPALGFFDVYPFLFSFVADHYQYHASMAALALLTAVLVFKRHSQQWAPVVWLSAAGVLIALTLLAHQKTYAYRSNESLVRDSIALNPRAWAAQFRYGAILSEAGDHEAALAHIREALRLFPEHAILHTHIANELAALKRLDEANIEFQHALKSNLHPDDRIITHDDLAGFLARQGRTAEAIKHYRAAIELDAKHSGAMFNLGVLLNESGDPAAALAMIRKAVEIRPSFLPAQRALASLLLERGERAEAIKHLQAAVKLFPQDAPLREQLGTAYFRNGDAGAAEEQLRQAIRIRPTADAHNLLGAVLGSQGDLAAARAQFEMALRIDPNHRGAAANLQKARGTTTSP